MVTLKDFQKPNKRTNKQLRTLQNQIILCSHRLRVEVQLKMPRYLPPFVFCSFEGFCSEGIGSKADCLDPKFVITSSY